MSLPRILPLFAFAAVFSSSAVLHAQVSPVSMRVEQVSGTDPEKNTTTQKRSLKIHLTNGSGQDQKGLKVKYYFFAKDVKDKDIIVKETGEKPADVAARKTEVVETPVVKTTFTDSHSQGGGGKGSKGGGKKVEASGDKFVGYGVQLYSGDKMLAEYFSQPSLKANVGGAATAKP